MNIDNRPIDLIVKPTEACNFACSFCSSSYLVENKRSKLDLIYIFEFLKRFPNTQTIIINGGDPLMMPVGYYWQLIEHLEQYNYLADISITTNLWKFWQEWQNDKKPKYWTELFRHKRVNVTTSFQYGEGRRISKNEIFTEKHFIAVSNLMLEKVGYRPSFISVIEEQDLDSCINNVRLAKTLGVDCKLNYANKSGDCDKPLPLSFIYEVYIKIYEEGLVDHEWNTRQMINSIQQYHSTACPLNRSCDSGIRVLQPDGRYFSCGAFGDDQRYEIDFQKEVHEGDFFKPLEDDINLQVIKKDCYTCDMFSICNGCKKHISDLKESNLTERHCAKMKSIAPKIMNIADNSPPIEIRNDTYYQGLNVNETNG